MRVLLAGLLLLAPLAAATSVPPLGEFPADWSCDSHQDTRVCAGAGGGAHVACRLTGAEAMCDWSVGWISRGWSEDLEPGTMVSTFRSHLEICSSVWGCDSEDGGFDGTCSWLPGLDCIEDVGPRTGGVGGTLQMGECLKVTMTATATAQSREEGVPIVGPGPASAAFTQVESWGGEVCLVDDGR